MAVLDGGTSSTLNVDVPHESHTAFPMSLYVLIAGVVTAVLAYFWGRRSGHNVAQHSKVGRSTVHACKI